MTSRVTFSSFLLPIVVSIALFCVRELSASEARLGGLGRLPNPASPLAGNPMVEDMLDVAELPGTLSAYSNAAFLTVFPYYPYGNAAAFFGESFIGGVWVNRNLRWDDNEMNDDLLTDFDLPESHNLADLFLGSKVGFGVRLSLTAGLSTTDQRAPNTNDLYSDGESVFGFELAPGYSLDLGGYRGDFGVGLSFNHFQVAIGGEPAYSTTWIPSFFIRHRSIIGDRAEITSWVIDVMVTRRAYGAKSLGQNPDKAIFGHWLSSLVFGPKFSLPRDFTVWAGLTVELEHLLGEVEGIPQPKLTGIGAPGAVLSGELLLFDILAIRAGLEYSVQWTIGSVPDVDDTDVDNNIGEFVYKARDMGHVFRWSAGLGAAVGDFLIDGSLSQELLFNGPALIGGGEPGFLGMISVTYLW